jgi:hypothetical protein
MRDGGRRIAGVEIDADQIEDSGDNLRFYLDEPRNSLFCPGRVLRIDAAVNKQVQNVAIVWFVLEDLVEQRGQLCPRRPRAVWAVTNPSRMRMSVDLTSKPFIKALIASSCWFFLLNRPPASA